MAIQTEQDNNTAATASKKSGRRGFIKKAGLAVPVATTLSGRKVFGANAHCFSVFLSVQAAGASNTHAFQCQTGNAPAFYAHPTNAWLPPLDTPPVDVATGGAWLTAGYDYATRWESGNGWACSDYSGGTAFNSIFGGNNNLPMREYLCNFVNSGTNRMEAFFITAFINSRLNTRYALTPSQVTLLYNNYLSTSNPDILNYLASTWT